MGAAVVSSKKRGGRPRQEDAARRIQQLLDTAAAIFIREGYAGSSIDRIAIEAGVGKPTIYAHFGSKANLLKMVIEHILKNRLVAIDDQVMARSAVEGLKEQLANIINAAMEPNFLGIFRLFLAEANKFPEIFRAFYDSTELQSKRLLVEHLSRHREFDKLKVPPEEVASTLLAMSNTLVMMAAVRPESLTALSPEREAGRYVDVVLHGLLAP